jgi:phenylacetate-CoA ligase
MFGWAWIAFERWMRADVVRLDRLVSHIPNRVIRGVSEAKLVRTLRWVYTHSAAQRERWNKLGIRLSDIRLPEILPRIPFTTGDELARSPEDYFCVPREELVHVLSTSGTSGLYKKIYLTQDDFERQMQMIATHLRRFPGATRALAIFFVREPTWSGGSIARRGVEKAGLFGLLSGHHRAVRDHVELIKEYGINLLITTPAYVHRMMVEAEEDLKALGVRYIHLSGQPWTEELRREIEAAWGAKAIDVYGSTECVCGLAAECRYQNGLHLSELDHWVEIIDPRSGKLLPEGQDGEIVVTTLSRRGMPLVRYRTGDLAHLIPEKGRCECGMPVRKISRVRGRVDDVLIVGAGNNVYPDEFDRAVLSVPGVTDYQLVIEKAGYKDVLKLTVEADRSGSELRETLVEALLTIPNVRESCEDSRTLAIGGIEVVPPGALSTERPKSIRIIDKRDTSAAGRTMPA